MRSKAACAPQDTRAAGVLSRFVRWRDAFNMQPIGGVGRNCKACFARCPSGALMCDTSPAFSNRPPRELPPVGFPAAGLCTGCLVHFRHAGPRVMLRGVPCWGHGSSTQRNGDQPGHRSLARDGGNPLGSGPGSFPCIRNATEVEQAWTTWTSGLPINVSVTRASPCGRVLTTACTSFQVGVCGWAWGSAGVWGCGRQNGGSGASVRAGFVASFRLRRFVVWSPL